MRSVTARTTVYLDYAASAPARRESLAAERAYEESPIAGANPNSLHTPGREAARALDGARRDIARCVGGGFRPSDVIFTSGGTESNNLALLGLSRGAHQRDRKRTRVVLSAIEHDSELDVTGVLRDRGFEVTLVKPGRDGVVSRAALEDALGPDCALVSVMSANNETGVVQPVSELAAAAHAAGALFHTDAVQAFGRIPLDISQADAVSLAAHKLGGPVGVGALLVRGRVPLAPQSFGGGQESGRRAGTQDVRGTLAFAAVARACCGSIETVRPQVAARAEKLYQRICAEGTGIVPTTTTTVDEQRLPGMVSVMVPGLDSQSLVLGLDERGYAVSAGSACSSGSLDASHVLTSMGIGRDQALGSLRISFDERVAEEDLETFAAELISLVKQTKARHQ